MYYRTKDIFFVGADWRLTYSTSLHGYSLANVYRNVIISFYIYFYFFFHIDKHEFIGNVNLYHTVFFSLCTSREGNSNAQGFDNAVDF